MNYVVLSSYKRKNKFYFHKKHDRKHNKFKIDIPIANIKRDISLFTILDKI